MFGQLTLASTATRPPARPAAQAARQGLRGSAVVVGGEPQMLATTRAPVAASAGSSASSQASTPGFCQPDAVEHAGRGRMHPGRRVAGPRLGGQRLDHDRAEGAEVEVGGELGAVAGGPRRRHHRVGQRRPGRSGGEIDAGSRRGPAGASPQPSLTSQDELLLVVPVVLLQAADRQGVAGPVGDAGGGRPGGGHRRQAGDLV